MLKNKNLIQKGFTIVELLIVIVVIAILAALVLNTFAGVQEKARDSDRQNDVATITKHLETYYTNHNNYPSYAQLSDANWVKDNMKGLAPDAFQAPGDTDSSLASSATGLDNNAKKISYVYVPLDGSSGTDAACTGDTTGTDSTCTKFSLTWYKEADDLSAQVTNSLSGQ
ncbi:MAG TPA: type II secretion system protein [Candidatus Saccharimonadales bacterium]|nr:type II secretion system protein [Candidatus Saccharimonadales bacterium]